MSSELKRWVEEDIRGTSDSTIRDELVSVFRFNWFKAAISVLCVFIVLGTMFHIQSQSDAIGDTAEKLIDLDRKERAGELLYLYSNTTENTFLHNQRDMIREKERGYDSEVERHLNALLEDNLLFASFIIAGSLKLPAGKYINPFYPVPCAIGVLVPLSSCTVYTTEDLATRSHPVAYHYFRSDGFYADEYKVLDEEEVRELAAETGIDIPETESLETINITGQWGWYRTVPGRVESYQPLSIRGNIGVMDYVVNGVYIAILSYVFFSLLSYGIRRVFGDIGRRSLAFLVGLIGVLVLIGAADMFYMFNVVEAGFVGFLLLAGFVLFRNSSTRAQFVLPVVSLAVVLGLLNITFAAPSIGDRGQLVLTEFSFSSVEWMFGMSILYCLGMGLAGAGVAYLVERFGMNQVSEGDDVQQAGQEGLVEYIETYMGQGYTEQEIVESLVDEGHREQDVEEAFRIWHDR